MARLSPSSRFRRYPGEGYVAGVCAGIAAYLDWNVKLIRALAVLTLIFGGGFPILLVYAVLWYVMDPAPGPAGLGPQDDAPAPAPGHRGSYAAGGASSMSDVKRRFAHLEERLRNMEECVTSNDYELRRELRKLEP